VPLPLVEWGVYSAGKIKANATNFEQDWDERGAIFTFDPSSNLEPETILARVGISLISTEQACRTANEELPDFDLARVREEARSQWNDLLGRIDVEFDDRETAVLFYSSVSIFSIIAAQTDSQLH
jgi:putative alpha-1,2-mannosidase